MSCVDCQGTGRFADDIWCLSCGGAGEVSLEAWYAAEEGSVTVTTLTELSGRTTVSYISREVLPRGRRT